LFNALRLCGWRLDAAAPPSPIFGQTPARSASRL
jgi:hypothetical protein